MYQIESPNGHKANIEIKDGFVYVDGKKTASYKLQDKTDHTFKLGFFEFSFGEKSAPTLQKALEKFLDWYHEYLKINPQP